MEAAGEAIVERGDDGRVSIPRLLLRPKVTVRSEEDRAPALKWILKAEETCLIARAMRAVVELEPEVLVAAEVLATSAGNERG